MDMDYGRRPLRGVCLGYFMVILDATVVNVALPAMGTQLHAVTSDLQWVVDAYTLVFAALLLSGGSLGDRWSGRSAFRAGLVVFVLASAACGLAPALPVLIAARVAQGAGAALLVPASLAVLRASYPRPAERARVIGLWAAAGGIAAVSGPVLGGVLVGTLGWRWVFFLNVPVGAVALWLLVRHVVPARTGARPEAGTAGASPTKRDRAGLDPGGQLAAVVALAALTAGMIEAGRRGWTAPPVLAAFAAAVLAAVAFVAVEHRVRAPMLPLGLFGSRNFSVAVSVGLLMNLAFYGQLLVVVLYLQQARHYPPLAAGLALLPQSGLVALASWWGGHLASRYGPRRPILAGMLVGACGMLALALLVGAGYPLLVVPLAAVGAGIAVAMPAATAAAVAAAPGSRSGIASGVLNAGRQVGSAIGVALLGALVAGDRFGAHLRTALLVGALAYLLAAILALPLRAGEHTGATEEETVAARA